MAQLLKRLFADLPNPGSLEQLKKEAQGIMSPDVFDGARFEFNKTLSPKFALNHNVFLGSANMPPSYEFGANFGDERVLLVSRVDMAGRLNGRLNFQFGESAFARLQAQASPEAPGALTSLKADLDYKGSSFCAGATYMGGGLLGANYMQSVTRNLALGGEGFYHATKQITGGAVAGRCVWGPKSEHVATAKAGSFGNVELSYQRKARRPRSPRYRPSCGAPRRRLSRAVARDSCPTRHRLCATQSARPRPRRCPTHSPPHAPARLAPPRLLKRAAAGVSVAGEREGWPGDGDAVLPQPVLHLRLGVRVPAALGDLQGADTERHNLQRGAGGAHQQLLHTAALGPTQPQEEGLQVRLRHVRWSAVSRAGVFGAG